MSFLYMAVFCYGILDGNELYHLSAGIALFLNSTLQTEWDQRSRFTLLWFLVFGSIVGLGERGNRTLGDFVFFRCHEFLVLLSKPHKHRA